MLFPYASSFTKGYPQPADMQLPPVMMVCVCYPAMWYCDATAPKSRLDSSPVHSQERIITSNSRQAATEIPSPAPKKMLCPSCMLVISCSGERKKETFVAPHVQGGIK